VKHWHQPELATHPFWFFIEPSLSDRLAGEPQGVSIACKRFGFISPDLPCELIHHQNQG
jgi:hypothetical protein